MKRLLAIGALFAGPLLFSTPAAATTSCEGLADLKLPHVRIAQAAMVRGGALETSGVGGAPRQLNGLPAFCRVTGVSTPRPGSRIGFEVWLPEGVAWSRRLHMIGNGGYASDIDYGLMATRIRASDVVVATDTGHQGADLAFGRERPEAIEDWGGGRAIHESVVAAKAITLAYLSAAPAYSYFSGCSTGGHQALSAVQRFPADFDGVIAGAPGGNRVNLNLGFLWTFQANHLPGSNTATILTADKLRLITRTAVAECDPQDGVTDGVINDPGACGFKVERLRCAAGDQPDCLTDAQVIAAQKIYQGPRDARTGASIIAGYPIGSEGAGPATSPRPGWAAYWNGANPAEPQRVDFFRWWAFNDANWNWWTFDWGPGVDAVRRLMSPKVDATAPDLSRFRARGGKLILFAGWQDPVVPPMDVVQYYQAVRAHAGAQAQDFTRLYMVPGMGHCQGGPGATVFSSANGGAPPVSDDQHDMGKAIEAWVETRRAPGTLIATRFEEGSGPSGKIGFQRPLCVFPAVARYRGGDSTRAGSFACEAPKG